MSIAGTNLANYNYGNIKTTGGGWASYGSPQEGVNAISNLIGGYQTNHQLNTVSDIINRYAPQSDPGNTGKNLVGAAAANSGLDPNATYDFSPGSPANNALTKAIIMQEQGSSSPAAQTALALVGGGTNGGYPGALTMATCPECDQALADARAAAGIGYNPNPPDPGLLTPGDPSTESPSYSPFYIPGTSNILQDPSGSGQPVQQAQSVGGTSIFPALGANIADFATRAALVLLAIVLIAAAAFALVSGERQKQILQLARG